MVGNLFAAVKELRFDKVTAACSLSTVHFVCHAVYIEIVVVSTCVNNSIKCEKIITDNYSGPKQYSRILDLDADDVILKLKDHGAARTE